MIVQKPFKKTGLLWALVLWVFTIAPVQADPMIDFDQVVDGGALSYNGEGGALIGADIRFDLVQGVDTPDESGTVLDCVNCLLNFVTGANLTEGPVYTWESGGFYTLTGTLKDGATEVASGTIVSGAWSDPVVGLTSGVSLIISGFGTDTKHPDLRSFFGIGPLGFVFATSEIAASVTLQGNGGFNGGISEADLVNTPTPQENLQITPTPEPGTILLLGTGLIGMTGYGWRHQKRRQAYGH